MLRQVTQTKSTFNWRNQLSKLITDHFIGAGLASSKCLSINNILTGSSCIAYYNCFYCAKGEAASCSVGTRPPPLREISTSLKRTSRKTIRSSLRGGFWIGLLWLRFYVLVCQPNLYKQETETKKKDAAREQLGVEAYDFQQMVAKQQHELDCCMSELENLSAAREQLEHELKEVSSKHKKHLGELLEAERKGKFDIHLFFSAFYANYNKCTSIFCMN